MGHRIGASVFRVRARDLGAEAENKQRDVCPLCTAAISDAFVNSGKTPPWFDAIVVVIKKATALRAGTGLAAVPAPDGTRTRVQFDSAVDERRRTKPWSW